MDQAEKDAIANAANLAEQELVNLRKNLTSEQVEAVQKVVGILTSWTTGQQAKKVHYTSWKALGHALQHVFNR